MQHLLTTSPGSRVSHSIHEDVTVTHICSHRRYAAIAIKQQLQPYYIDVYLNKVIWYLQTRSPPTFVKA